MTKRFFCVQRSITLFSIALLLGASAVRAEVKMPGIFPTTWCCNAAFGALELAGLIGPYAPSYQSLYFTH